MPKNKKALAPSQANKLALELLVIKIKCAQTALKYTFDGKSYLWGKPIDEADLVRLKTQLAELDRKQQLYDANKTENMPYLPSGSSVIEKIKDHFADDKRYAFTEVKEGQSGKMIVNHVHSKSYILKQIKTKQMATKKKAASKKAATKKATSKKATSKKASAPKEGDSIKSFVDKCVSKGMDNAAIFAALDKAGYAYSINSVRWYASKARAL